MYKGELGVVPVITKKYFTFNTVYVMVVPFTYFPIVDFCLAMLGHLFEGGVYEFHCAYVCHSIQLVLLLYRGKF